LIDLFIYSFIHFFIDSFIHSSIHSFIRSFINKALTAANDQVPCVTYPKVSVFCHIFQCCLISSILSLKLSFTLFALHSRAGSIYRKYHDISPISILSVSYHIGA